jgi:uncharacterized membrane protein YphA (DoxX/SURF4 family)
MALTRRLARPLLASIFVVGGWDALWNPAGKAKRVEVVSEPLAEKTGVDDLNAEMLVRVNGAIQIGGGFLLASGRFRRIGALALIGSIIPTTYAGHRFWDEADPTTRTQQKMHFLKNVGLLGGLILAAFDTEGEPSLAWRAKRQARQLEASLSANRPSGRRKGRHGRGHLGPVVSQAARTSTDSVLSGTVAGRRAARRFGTTGHDVLEKVIPSPDALSHAGDVVADALKGSSETATQAAQQAASFVSDASRQLEPMTRNGVRPAMDAIVSQLGSGADRTAEAMSKVREHLPSV